VSIQTIVPTTVNIAPAAQAAAPLDIEILGATLTGPQETAWTNEYGANLIVEVARDSWADVMDSLGITDGEGVYEYLQLTFSQPTHPRLVQLGRRATPVAQQTDFLLVGGAGAAADGLYRITLEGTNFDVSAVSQTRAQVVTALQGLIAADPLYSAAIGGTPETVDVTSSEAGVSFAFAASAPVGESWTITPTTANVGLTTDVPLWEAERLSRGLDPFYVVTIPEAVTEGLARTVAEFAPSFTRDIVGVLRTDSATDPNATTGGNIAQALAGSGYGRLMLTYVPTATDYDWAAALARRLPTDPGTATWAGMTLVGVDGELYTATEDGVLTGSYYYFDKHEAATSAYPRSAVVLDGTRIDVVRGVDYTKALVQTSVLNLLISVANQNPPSKIPFTTQGYQTIEAAIRAPLDERVRAGFIPAVNDATGEPGYSVTVPPVPVPGDANRAAGIAVGFAFEFDIAGSVERVELDGLAIQ
jgi:hypothetical protein